MKKSKIDPEKYAEALLASLKSEMVSLSDASCSERDYPDVPHDGVAWQDLDIGGLPEMMSQRSRWMPFNI